MVSFDNVADAAFQNEDAYSHSSEAQWAEQGRTRDCLFGRLRVPIPQSIINEPWTDVHVPPIIR